MTAIEKLGKFHVSAKVTKRLAFVSFLLVLFFSFSDCSFPSNSTDPVEAQIDKVVDRIAHDTELVEEYDYQVYAATPSADVQSDDPRYILFVFYIESTASELYPPVPAVKLVLYDREDAEFVVDKAPVHSLYTQYFFKRHAEAIEKELIDVISKGLATEAIDAEMKWAEAEARLDFQEAIGLAGTGEQIIRLIDHPLDLMAVLENTFSVSFKWPTVQNDALNAMLSIANRNHEVLACAEMYDAACLSPNSTAAMWEDRFLSIDEWEIGEVNRYSRGKERYEIVEQFVGGLTWNELFGTKEHIRGWFAQPRVFTGIDRSYATLAGLFWSVAKVSLVYAQKILEEFVTNPNQANYRKTLSEMARAFDWIRVGYIFKSIAYSQKYKATSSSNRCVPKCCCYELYTRLLDGNYRSILPYPYSPDLFDATGFCRSQESTGDSITYVPAMTWCAEGLDMIRAAIQASEEAMKLRELTLGLIEDRFLLGGHLEASIERIVVPPECEPLEVSLALDKTTYIVGDQAAITLIFNKRVAASLIRYLSSGQKLEVLKGKAFSAGAHELTLHLTGIEEGVETLELVARDADGSEVRRSFSFLVGSLALTIPLKIDISVDKDTYNVGEYVYITMAFNRPVTASLIEYLPNRARKVIFEHRKYEAGTHSLVGSVTDEGGLGVETLKLIAHDTEGDKAEASVAFVVNRTTSSEENDSNKSWLETVGNFLYTVLVLLMVFLAQIYGP